MAPPIDPLKPLWHATAPPLATHPAIRRGGEALPPAVDTIVIGAGVTGLSTALHLAERGARVAVLEREEPGMGTTGRANGEVIAGLHMDPDDLVSGYGAEPGERMVEFCGSGPDRLFELVARHGIDCDAERGGWIQPTRSKRQLDSLERLAASWARRGAPVRMLDRQETAELLGTSVYAGAWLDQRNGTIQPFAYARGLALAAARLGASIHCGVEAGELRRDGGRWRLATSHGEIRAETVVVATNVFTSELHGAIRALLGRTYLSVHSVQLASEPLDARQRESVLPQRHSCGDTSHLRLRYFRLDRENRFVIGGPGWLTPPGSATSPSFRLLEADTRRMFPQLAKTRFEYRWFARDTITPDVVPHLYEPCAGLFASLGYNGRGLAIGTGLGSVLARRVLGEAADALPYPTTQRSAVPLGLPAAIAFYFKLVSGRFHGRHR